MNMPKLDVIRSFEYDAGWRIAKHIGLVADTIGNKHTDLVGFGETGVWVSQNNGDNTFQGPKFVLTGFSYSWGWRVDKYLRFMADIRKLVGQKFPVVSSPASPRRSAALYRSNKLTTYTE